MLSESFLVSTLASSKGPSTNSILKDTGIHLHEFQPRLALRQSFKKSSTLVNCLAVSESHIFAAQADKAVVHLYSRDRGNLEATVPFPERIGSLAYAGVGTALLVIGTEGGRLILWELASGRLVTTAASHLQPVTSTVVTENHDFCISGSGDSVVHVWCLPDLLSFSQPSSFATNARSCNGPIRTFTNHRSAITALCCGHSTSPSNFVISGSQDKTCYIWSLATCGILRIVLLPEIPLCFQLDPADRAVYAGYEGGSIQCIDFYKDIVHDRSMPESIQNVLAENMFQLGAGDVWSNSGTNIGSVHCICLTFDGTTLLSGHQSGKVLSWDVAKGRMQKSIIDLGQSVTNLIMLRPDGLPIDKPKFKLNSVVKPKLDFYGAKGNGLTDVPYNYALTGQIANHAHSRAPVHLMTAQPLNEFHLALASPTFPQDMIDDTIQDLLGWPQFDATMSGHVDGNLVKIERLEEQIEELNRSLTHFTELTQRSRVRRMARMEKREELGFQKRTAYFTAEEKGEDGDDAMREFIKKEQEIDMLSDEEGTQD